MRVASARAGSAGGLRGGGVTRVSPGTWPQGQPAEPRGSRGPARGSWRVRCEGHHRRDDTPRPQDRVQAPPGARRCRCARRRLYGRAGHDEAAPRRRRVRGRRAGRRPRRCSGGRSRWSSRSAKTTRGWRRRSSPRCCRDTGGRMRVGITGVPGVGKSSLIEALGGHLTRSGGAWRCWRSTRARRAAAAASSATRRGCRRWPAIPGRSCGRRRRSGRSAGWPGTRARRCCCARRRASTWCSSRRSGSGSPRRWWRSWSTASWCCCSRGPGDELQGIKRGILELVDVLAITKADGGPVIGGGAGARGVRGGAAPRAGAGSGVDGAGADLLGAHGGRSRGAVGGDRGAPGGDDLVGRIRAERAGSRSTGCGGRSRRGCCRDFVKRRRVSERVAGWRRRCGPGRSARITRQGSCSRRSRASSGERMCGD
jgi:hypothetical protein